MLQFETITSQLGNIKIKTAIDNVVVHILTPIAHAHVNFEYHFLLKGKLQLNCDNKCIILEENDSILIFPGKYHDFTCLTDEITVVTFNFSLKQIPSQSEVDTYSVLAQKLNECTDMIVLYKKNDDLRNLCRQFALNNETDTFFKNDITKALLNLIYARVFGPLMDKEIKLNSLNAETTEDDIRNRIVETYFSRNYKENISLETLADILYLSTKQTARIIRKIYGKSFKECLTQTRLQIAKRLLTDTNIDIKDIAFNVGFQSYNGFYMAFKKCIGITPLAYRKKQNRIHEENDTQ